MTFDLSLPKISNCLTSSNSIQFFKKKNRQELISLNISSYWSFIFPFNCYFVDPVGQHLPTDHHWPILSFSGSTSMAPRWMSSKFAKLLPPRGDWLGELLHRRIPQQLPVSWWDLVTMGMNGTWNGTGSKLIITWNTIFGGMNIHDFVAIFGTHQSTVWFWRVFTHCHSHTRTTGQDLIVESSSGTVGLFPKSAIWARFESHLWLYNYIYTHIHVCVNMGNICLSA